MAESAYQARVIKRLRDMLPGCFIMKNDTRYIQGVPDLTVLYKTYWAVLEVKAHAGARMRPNQEHYVRLLNDMSFAAVIYPENEEEVFRALQLAFESCRPTRLSQRK